MISHAFDLGEAGGYNVCVNSTLRMDIMSADCFLDSVGKALPLLRERLILICFMRPKRCVHFFST